MSKPNLGTIDYHPFSEIPDESVSFTVAEDMTGIVPLDYFKTKESRRNRARTRMGAEVFDKLEEQNEQLRHIPQKSQFVEKQLHEHRKQLDEKKQKEQEKEEQQRTKELKKKQLAKEAKRIAEMEALWFSESTTPHPSSEKPPLFRWWPTKGGRRRRSFNKLKRRRISRK
jgi:hypothetical protein